MTVSSLNSILLSLSHIVEPHFKKELFYLLKLLSQEAFNILQCYLILTCVSGRPPLLPQVQKIFHCSLLCQPADEGWKGEMAKRISPFLHINCNRVV